MKKLLALLLIFVLVFSFTSCAVLDTIKGLFDGEQPDNGDGGGDDKPGETCEHVDANDIKPPGCCRTALFNPRRIDPRGSPRPWLCLRSPDPARAAPRASLRSGSHAGRRLFQKRC